MRSNIATFSSLGIASKKFMPYGVLHTGLFSSTSSRASSDISLKSDALSSTDIFSKKTSPYG